MCTLTLKYIRNGAKLTLFFSTNIIIIIIMIYFFLITILIAILNSKFEADSKMTLKTDNINKEHAKSNSDNLAKKIVIRRLPPTMTKEQFLEIISPMPECDYFYYCQADMR